MVYFSPIAFFAYAPPYHLDTQTDLQVLCDAPHNEATRVPATRPPKACLGLMIVFTWLYTLVHFDFWFASATSVLIEYPVK
jgi:hypothetical protein